MIDMLPTILHLVGTGTVARAVITGGTGLGAAAGYS